MKSQPASGVSDKLAPLSQRQILGDARYRLVAEIKNTA
jgi:hypothetical protein